MPHDNATYWLGTTDLSGGTTTSICIRDEASSLPGDPNSSSPDPVEIGFYLKFLSSIFCYKIPVGSSGLYELFFYYFQDYFSVPFQ